MNIWRCCLPKRATSSAPVWSFSMPNTYIGLPFFDVDNEELAARKNRIDARKAATRGATDPLSKKRRGRRSARLVFAMEKLDGYDNSSIASGWDRKCFPPIIVARPVNAAKRCVRFIISRWSDPRWGLNGDDNAPFVWLVTTYARFRTFWLDQAGHARDDIRISLKLQPNLSNHDRRRTT